jgi:hypothetical protein
MEDFMKRKLIIVFSLSFVLAMSLFVNPVVAGTTMLEGSKNKESTQRIQILRAGTAAVSVATERTSIRRLANVLSIVDEVIFGVGGRNGSFTSSRLLAESVLD